MPIDARTSPLRCSRSPELLIVLLLSVLGGTACQVSRHATAISLCAPGEQVMFHCKLGDEVVALCAEGRADRGTLSVDTLTYREGAPSRIALSWTADAQSGRRFGATAQPLSPRASVRQLWFEDAGVTHLLSQCVGGDCPSAAVVAVLRNDVVVSVRRCERSADDRAWFAPELVRWGGDSGSSRALTERIEVDDVDFGVDRLYPRPSS